MTDQEYIKMILALPDEFFDGWEWQAGDKALVNNEVWTVFEGNSNGMVVIGENLQQFSIGDLDFSYKIGDKARPIPNQEQLQEIIKKQCLSHNVKLKDIEILKRVVDWHIRRDPKHTLERSAECLFLEVVQWLNDKTWNGEAWV